MQRLDDVAGVAAEEAVALSPCGIAEVGGEHGAATAALRHHLICLTYLSAIEETIRR